MDEVRCGRATCLSLIVRVSPRNASAVFCEHRGPVREWMPYRTTRAPPPAICFSTSLRVAIEVSPGVVEARAPWAAP